MSKKVLIICTGNSCRSIIAEALINVYIEGVEAYSCGVNPSGIVNPNARKILEAHGKWDEKYYSKNLEALSNIEFDLIITVCDHAKETCPIFPKPTTKIHVGFEDPDGKGYEAFEATYKEMKDRLIPKVKAIFSGDVINLEDTDKICYCIGVDKGKIVQNIKNGATSLKMIKDTTKACTGSSCKDTNPLKRCCSKEINQLIKIYKPTNIQKNVFSTNSGVKINFTGAVKKQQILKMVENCATGSCECMSDDTKKKMTNMEIEGIDGDIELKLTGEISKEEIEKALSRSKVLNRSE